MESADLLELIAALVVAGAVFSVFLWLLWNDPPRRAQRALNRNPQLISALKDGQLATLEGQLIPLVSTTSDAEDTPVFSQVQLEVFFAKVGSDGARSEGWKAQTEITSTRPAQLVEDSKALCVDLASCLPLFDGETTPIDWSSPSLEAKALSEKIPDLDTRWPARLRFRKVLAGDTVRVAGKVKADPNGSLRLVAPSEKTPLALRRIC